MGLVWIFLFAPRAFAEPVLHVSAIDPGVSMFALLLSGAIISLLVHNAFIYLALRERVQLHYLFFAAVNGYIALATTVFPEIFPWRILAFYRPLCPLSTIVFTQSFFQTKVHYPRLHTVSKGVNRLLLAMIPAAFFIPLDAMLNLQNNVFLILIACLFGFACHTWRLGHESARLYLLAIGAFLIGVLCHFLVHFGLLPTNAFTSIALLQGQTYEVFLMSLALASRMRRLKEEKVAADMVARHKGHLLRVISHDMATPLSVIHFLAKYIRDTSSTFQEHTEKIVRAATTIQSIRDFTMKVEHVSHPGAIAPSLGPVSLGKVFEDLHLLFEHQAQHKGVGLTFSLPDETLCVKGDQIALTTAVFSNLISNAIKFSHRGGTVFVGARDEGDYVAVTIEDNGIGTQSTFLREGMGSDHGSTTQGTAGERGSGFGLAIMEEYVHAFGGKVIAESRPQETYPDRHGTTFTIYLLRVK